MIQTHDKRSNGITCGTLKSWSVLKNQTINGSILALINNNRVRKSVQQCAVTRTILVRDGIIAIGDLYQALETHVICMLLFIILYRCTM